MNIIKHMPFASRPFNFTTNYIKYSDTLAGFLTPLYTPTINGLALIYLTQYGPKFKAGALANSKTNTKLPKNVCVIVIHRSFSKLNTYSLGGLSSITPQSDSLTESGQKPAIIAKPAVFIIIHILKHWGKSSHLYTDRTSII
jgi:hypothetical protein